MNAQVDSKGLFVKQVQSHSQSLCDLLSCDATAPVPSELVDRCAVATRMLAGTSSLMDLTGWESVLVTYEEVLACYDDRGLLWDERIAQFTSELIEMEDSLVATYEEDPTVAVEAIVSNEQLASLGEEAAALQEAALTARPPETAAVTASEAAVDPPTPPRQPEIDAAPEVGLPVDSSTTPMRGVLSELESEYQSLIARLRAGAVSAQGRTADEIAAIRNHLYFLDFYVCSIEQMFERQSPLMPVKKCSLLPLQTVLSDFANETSTVGDNVLDIVLNGADTQIDPRLLPIAGAIIQRLINDVFNRSEISALGISIDVTGSRGAIRWRLADNGDNFISDSQLDHEDQLAFYPGLKSVRKLLRRHHGVLWVEPGDDNDCRFAFSMPVSQSEDTFTVWGDNRGMFGVRSVQLCNLIPVGNAPRGEDSSGEFLALDNKRVPLLRLDVLFKEAPSDGSTIAVIGSLEKRVAFYVPDTGALVNGKALEGGISAWQGPPHMVAQVNDRRIALLDADQVLEGYLDLTGDLNADGVSGGVVDDESELSNSQASFDSDEVTPPDQLPEAEDVGEVEVLVVEQSESLRGELIDILNVQHISAAYAGDVDEAIELIHARAPRVIVSEFRMPTMAAKVLVDALASEGMRIPVLVTTSQSGKTADLLVEKLGAAGYLSKPLDQQEVAERLSGFLSERASA